jgi:putative hemolysin
VSEFSLVSAKKTRLKQRAESGDTQAAAAIKLTSDPTPFLSTVQIGIIIGILAGAFGGVTISEKFSAYLGKFHALSPYSNVISIILVVLLITHLTLVFGELVPKRLALNNAESIASSIAKPIFFFLF